MDTRPRAARFHPRSGACLRSRHAAGVLALGLAAAGLSVAASAPAPAQEQALDLEALPFELIDLEPEERGQELAGLEPSELGLLWKEVGESGLPPEDVIELYADVLLALPGEERLAALSFDARKLVEFAWEQADSSAPLDQRLRLLEGLRDGLSTDSGADRYLWLFLTSLRVARLFSADRHGAVFDEVARAEAGGTLLQQPAWPEATTFYVEKARELGHSLLVARARSAAYLGFADERLGELEASDAMLREMRAEYDPESAYGIDRTTHAECCLGLTDAYLMNWRYERAIDVIEEALDERLLFEARQAGEAVRGDLEAKLRLNLGVARIGSELSALRPKPGVEPFSAAFKELASLAAVEGAAEGVPEVVKARLWILWIELERAARAEDLAPVRMARAWFDGIAPESFAANPAMNRFHRVLEARLLRLEGIAPRRALLAEFERDLLARWSGIEARASGLGPTKDGAVTEYFAEVLALELESHDDPAEAVRATILAVERVLGLGSLPRRLGGSSEEVGPMLERLTKDGRALLYAIPTGFGSARIALVEADRALLSEPVALGRLERHETTAGAVAKSPAERGARGLGLLLEGIRDELLSPAIRERLVELKHVAAVGFADVFDQPLAALPWPGEGGGTLGTRLALLELPSLSVAAALADRRLPETLSSQLLVAEPDGKEAGVIEAVGLPSGSLERLAPGAEAGTLLAGTDASLARLGAAAAQARDLDALVIVAHGVRVPQEVRPSGIQLAPVGKDARAGVLLPPEAERLDLEGTGLVVLAVCRAGSGPEREGDAGSASLGGAFLVAGAAAVLQASGDLPTEATAALVEVLLEGWREGLPLDEALRRARAEIASRPGWADPFFHAQLRLWAVPGA